MNLINLILASLDCSLFAHHFTFVIEVRVLLSHQVKVVSGYELVHAGSIIARWVEVSHGAVVVTASLAHLSQLVLFMGH